MSAVKRIALVGTPNAGKTALFNQLTHSHQRVANYSGVTVDSAEADFHLDPKSEHHSTLVDLPGAYSLRPYTEDEGVLASALDQNQFDGMILVVDATQPERAIRFLIEVLDRHTTPAVVAFNMIDLAESRGFRFDIEKLSQILGVPVVVTVATKNRGFQELTEKLALAMKNQLRKKDYFLGEKRSDLTGRDISIQILSFYKKADEVLKQVLLKKGGIDLRSEKIDQIILHRVFGPLILILVLGLTFQLMFNFAQVPMDWIDGSFKWMSAQVNHSGMPEVARSFLADGILAGVGSTVVFLPQILILFGLILFLEDFGFMARAVFLLDHFMGRFGLQGRSFLPILSSYACNVPGIMATRAMESKRDRIITTMMIPLTTCSARIPVYTLLISAFIPNTVVWGAVHLQGLVMLGLYGVGLLFAVIAGAVFNLFVLRGKRLPLLMELPSYKTPSLRSMVRGLAYRAKLFLSRVGSVILIVSVVIWALVSFPKTSGTSSQQIEQSIAARVGHVMEPVLKPIGFDWRIGMALIPTFAAREVMVSTLSTVYSVEDGGDVSNSGKLSRAIQKQWPLATGLSLLVWFIFAPMCMSTLATVRRELKSTKWMAVMVVYLFTLAYLTSWITFHSFSSL